MTSALWWVRRDLRLADNQALSAALKYADRVLPVFILDSTLEESQYVGVKRRAFLLGGMQQLDADFRSRGSRLVVRQGIRRDELAALMSESGADIIFAEYIHEPWRMPTDVQGACGCIMGKDYPYPIVDHSQMRQRAIKLYQNAAKAKADGVL